MGHFNVGLYSRLRLLRIALLCGGSLLPGAALGAPAGGVVKAGSAAITAPSTTQTVISQTSSKAIIDWSSFSTVSGERIQFNNGSGATLNRVTGTGASSLAGALSATGSVYLINPNGVIIGRTGVIHVGGSFVASTLDLADQAFLSSGPLTFSGTSQKSVVNYGKIGALGGDVALIAAAVDNEGSVNAANGSAGLIAGFQATLTDGALNGGRFAVLLGGPSTSVVNAGQIQAAVAELRANGGNIYALAGNTGGVIQATAVAAGGGRVFLVAEGGSLQLAGDIVARGAGAGAGVIETSAASVEIGHATIDAGPGGTWLIDPVDLTIDQTAADTLAVSLNAGSNVIEQTNASGSGGSGDILLAAGTAIHWNSPASLTLSAYRNIQLGAGSTITSSGTGGVTLYADNTGLGVGSVTFGPGSSITAPTVAIYYDPSVNPAGSGVNPTSYANPQETFSANVNGALSTYFLVNSVSDLQNMANNLSAHYALGRDIEAGATAGWDDGTGGGIGFVPIGTFAAPFVGSLDGQGHVVTNLVIDQPNASFIGLFGVERSATISNLGLVGGTVDGLQAVGQLVGYGDGGTISNSYVTGAVSGGLNAPPFTGSAQLSAAYVGGLIGYDLGVVTTQDRANGSVTVGAGATAIGGFAGLSLYGAISNSSAAAAVNAGPAANGIGGLVGQDTTGTIQQSSASGPVTTGYASSNIGGLVGAASGGAVNGSSASGAVLVDTSTGFSSNIGGLIGASAGTLVSESFATGEVIGPTLPAISAIFDVGGLIGSNAGTVTYSYASGQVSGSTAIGGLVGNNAGSIATSYATGPVSAMEFQEQSTGVGGLVGNNSGAIGRSYATGAVSGSYPIGSGATGGLVGENYGGVISSSYATGTVRGGGGNYTDSEFQAAGGLVGVMTGGSIDTSYASGLTTGGGSVGGLVGFAQNTRLTSVYATGEVITNLEAPSWAGGLVGRSVDSTINDAYASGSLALAQASAIGGLVGASVDSQISYAYATGSLAGVASPAAGGLVGMADGGSISQTYATGPVANSGSFIGGGTGGLIGVNTGTSVSASYWDVQTSGQTTSAGGVGLATAQFYSTAGLAGFTFSTTPNSDGWVIVDADGTLNNAGGAPGATRPLLLSEYTTTIVNAHQLQLMALAPGAAYVLGADVDASGTSGSVPAGIWSTAGFAPVGTFAAPFTGSLDGQGHVVQGLTLNQPSASFLGLFGVTNSATISNLGLVGGSVVGLQAVGQLVGYGNGGVISNSYVTGSVAGGLGAASDGSGSPSAAYLGDLIGYDLGVVTSQDHATGSVTAGNGASAIGGFAGIAFYGAVSGSSASGAVSAGAGSSAVGGLVGQNTTSTIEQSSASGVVSTGPETIGVGGLVGVMNGGLVDQSFASGAVQVSGPYYAKDVGGLVGQNSGGAIRNSYTTGNVDAEVGTGGYNDAINVGGLVGLNAGEVSNSYATGDVTGTSYVGGLVGANSATVSASYATGHVSAGPTDEFSYGIGGLVGENAGAVTGSYATGKVDGASQTGSVNVGGLVGQNDSGTIANAYASGAVNSGGAYFTEFYGGGAGGLVGGMTGGSITASYATGPVTGASAVGGLAGFTLNTSLTQAYASGTVVGGGYPSWIGGLVGRSTNTQMSYVYATGQVQGGESFGAGGLLGYSLGSQISYAYATGNVDGGNSQAVGGLVGLLESSSLNQTYSVGAVSHSVLYQGGLVGSIQDQGYPSSITASYWDVQSSGQTSSAGGVGLTTAQFTSALPPGFTPSIWKTGPGPTYPYLTLQVGP